MKILKNKMAMKDMASEAETARSMLVCICDELKCDHGYLPYLRAKIDAAKKAVERIDSIAEKYEGKLDDE